MNSEHFFIVGAQRSGTTYLYRMLDAHPEITMATPHRPEPKFFLREDFDQQTPATYHQRHFHNASIAHRLGEKSTSYIEYEQAAARIAAWFPAATILIIMRNPVHRAISNYQFTRSSGLEPLPIAEAFRQENDRHHNYDKAKISTSPYAYLQRGHYIRYLRMYETLFPATNIIPLIFERFVGQLMSLQTLYRQLGVDDSFIPPALTDRVNSTNQPEVSLSPALQAWAYEHFAASTAQLEAHLGVSLPEWKPT